MIFVMEDTLEDFNKQVQLREAAGGHMITGSFYVNSLETDTPLNNSFGFLNDVTHLYGVTLRKDNQTRTLAVENDPDTFFNTINVELDNQAEPVIGSLYFKSLRRNGYVDALRCYQTWYCCFMT